MPGNSSRKLTQAPEKKRRRTNRGSVPVQDVESSRLVTALDFHSVWRELRAAGWTSKPPRNGLDNMYRYVLPGGSAQGLEGTDFLLGEEAVLSNFAKQAAENYKQDGTMNCEAGDSRGVGAVSDVVGLAITVAENSVSEAVDVVLCNVVVVLLASVVEVVDKAVCNVVIVMLAGVVEAAVMLRSARSLFKCQTKAPLITM
ncbi:hypothetical protein PR002_g10607 [Phytophthora rubi]|uniref:Uncharacterized protein n=1 Tax=Phytophthora rubi TaxID=129364 RepID=A0A6A3MD07_9STRA|nr:hypothetical protein PR002_g10607 [Phytophthora rubi]